MLAPFRTLITLFHARQHRDNYLGVCILPHDRSVAAGSAARPVPPALCMVQNLLSTYSGHGHPHGRTSCPLPLSSIVNPATWFAKQFTGSDAIIFANDGSLQVPRENPVARL